MRHLFLFIIALVVVSLYACSDDSSSNATSWNEPPNGTATLQDTEIPLHKGGYNWEYKRMLSTQHVTTDAASPWQIASSVDAVPAPSGEKIRFHIEGAALHVYELIGEGARQFVELDGTSLRLPNEDGTYAYEIEATWPNGACTYVIKFETMSS